MLPDIHAHPLLEKVLRVLANASVRNMTLFANSCTEHKTSVQQYGIETRNDNVERYGNEPTML